MHLLIDMSLSPAWCPFLTQADIQATHWSDIGPMDAQDLHIFQYAQDHNYIVFTHDLDFGDILALSGAAQPSVIQIRADDPTPQTIGSTVLTALGQFEGMLATGALVVIDPTKSRARVLPI